MSFNNSSRRNSNGINRNSNNPFVISFSHESTMRRSHHNLVFSSNHPIGGAVNRPFSSNPTVRGSHQTEPFNISHPLYGEMSHLNITQDMTANFALRTVRIRAAIECEIPMQILHQQNPNPSFNDVNFNLVVDQWSQFLRSSTMESFALNLGGVHHHRCQPSSHNWATGGGSVTENAPNQGPFEIQNRHTYGFQNRNPFEHNYNFLHLQNQPQFQSWGTTEGNMTFQGRVHPNSNGSRGEDQPVDTALAASISQNRAANPTANLTGISSSSAHSQNNELADENSSIRSEQADVGEDNLHNHYDGRIHSLPRQENDPYTCPTCGNQFLTSQNFAAHVRSHHYRFETAAEMKERHAARAKKNPFHFYQSECGLTLMPGSPRRAQPTETPQRIAGDGGRGGGGDNSDRGGEDGGPRRRDRSRSPDIKVKRELM